ncbi:MAG: hypothetical protein M3N82_09500 [Pseudomonadota bacterium]|nr:hypothetical protein [Pseudomonadota bacterium]
MNTIPLAIAAAATLFSTVALADATASASLSQLRVQLFDLDPADGITPSLTFQGGTTISMWAYSPGGDGTFQNSWPGVFSQQSHEVIEPSSQSRFALTGDAFTAPGALVTASAAAQYSHFSEAYTEFYFLGGSFTLSAHTEVIISGLESNAVSITSTPTYPQSQQFARAGSYLTIAGPDGAGINTSSLSDTLDAPGDRGHGSSSNEGELSVSYSNLDGASILGTIDGGTSAVTTSVVPEPDTVDLLALGALLVAGAFRRPGRASARRPDTFPGS